MQQSTSTIFVSKNADTDEALAGLDLLNKHEQALKRYDMNKKIGTSSFDKFGKIKPEWKNSQTSPMNNI